MPHVVTDNCQDCRFTDCVTVCPVDCFYGDERMLYIHPDECIDCGLCIPECPVEAIFSEDDVPEGQEQWVAINSEKCLSGELDQVNEQSDPLPTAAEKKEKLGF